MTEREKERKRLIELLRKPIPIIKGYNTVGEGRMSIVDAEKRADTLLSNGVIVPPCKVGDILYFPISHRVIAYEVSKIKYDGDLLKIVTHNKLSGCQRTIWSQDVGTTIFLTKEEAEKALKEREDK